MRRRQMLFGMAATAGLLGLGRGPAGAAMLTGKDYPALFGEVRRIEAKFEDTLLDLAYENGLGYVEMVAANPGVDPWLPGAGTEVVLPHRHILPPAPREGIVVNLSEMRLYFFPPDGGAVRTYPVGIGRGGLTTPTGSTRIVRKRENPTWYPTENAREENPELPKVVGPGPDNPLGTRALYFDWPLYLIHGTNNIWGIGRRISRGCIRMYPADVEELYEIVPVGTPVTVVDRSIKLAWHEDELYIQAHPTQEQASQIESDGAFDPDGDDDLSRLLGQALGGRIAPIHWSRMEQAARERRGVPVKISL